MENIDNMLTEEMEMSMVNTIRRIYTPVNFEISAPSVTDGIVVFRLLKKHSSGGKMFIGAVQFRINGEIFKSPSMAKLIQDIKYACQ